MKNVLIITAFALFITSCLDESYNTPPPDSDFESKPVYIEVHEQVIDTSGNIYLIPSSCANIDFFENESNIPNGNAITDSTGLYIYYLTDFENISFKAVASKTGFKDGEDEIIDATHTGNEDFRLVIILEI